MGKDNWDPEFIKKTKIENEKRKKHLAAKKKRMYKKRIISIALLVMFLLCIITVIKSCTSGNGSLDSRDGFIEFTNEKIKKEGYENVDKLNIDYNYDKYSSKAVLMSNVSGDIKDECKKYIDSKEKTFKKLNKAHGNAHIYIVGQTYEFKGMKCIDIKTLNFKKSEDVIKSIGTSVKTLCFNEKSNRLLSRFSLYKQDYKVKLKKAITQSLKSLSEVQSKTADILKSVEGLDIAVSKNGDVNLYLDKQKYIKEEEGIIKISLPGDILRDDIEARKIDPSKPMIALTYDDGPGEHTDRLLKLFERVGGACTLFQLGVNIENKDPDHKILKKAVSTGMELASHSYNHPNLLTLSKKKVIEQNHRTDEAFKKAVGFAPRLYRPPYGAGNGRTTKLFNKSAIFWSIDTYDWRHKSAKHLAKFITSQKKLVSAVVLMHDIHKSTVEASMKAVPSLKKKGYQLVTVSELLKYKYGIDPEKTRHYSYSFFK